VKHRRSDQTRSAGVLPGVSYEPGGFQADVKTKSSAVPIHLGKIAHPNNLSNHRSLLDRKHSKLSSRLRSSGPEIQSPYFIMLNHETPAQRTSLKCGSPPERWHPVVAPYRFVAQQQVRRSGIQQSCSTQPAARQTHVWTLLSVESLCWETLLLLACCQLQMWDGAYLQW
jgi:hypothetical protein